jgi:SOS-response transcriptional repressor LexA
MAPLVRNGDLVVFEIQEDFSEGDLVVILDPWGELLVRRYRRRHPDVFLVSENPDFPPQKIDTSYELIGLVQAVWHSVKF